MLYIKMRLALFLLTLLFTTTPLLMSQSITGKGILYVKPELIRLMDFGLSWNCIIVLSTMDRLIR